MSKLLEHFKLMQAMMAAYIAPNDTPYVDRDGTSDDIAGPGLQQPQRNWLFANDMIYMLDGPEQRDAQRAESMRESEFADMQDALAAMRDRVAVSDSDRGRATAALGEERKIQNDLRSRLMDSELAYAKLRGYLEGKRDSEPPRMVPEQREHFHAQLPDGSRGTDMGGWAGDGRRPAPWYHR